MEGTLLKKGSFQNGYMCLAIETFGITKKFTQMRSFQEILKAPFSWKEVVALQDVSLKVKQGEVFCLLGPNGAGKTTLIKILCTLMLPTEGRAMVNGLDVVAHPAKVRKAIGYVISEERSFYWRLTAWQNLKFFGILNNIPAAELTQRISHVLKLVGLSDKAKTLFKDFSLGMKQRLAIARSLLTDPQVLFMDEPTRSLDPASAESLRCFIRRQLVDREGKTVFLATHNLKEVEEIGHRLAIIHEGRVKACGRPQDLLLERLERYVIRLQSLTPDFIGRLSQQLDSQISIKADGMSELEITLGTTTSPEAAESRLQIPDVIACMVSLGARIEGCLKKEIPLSEIYAAYTRDDKIID
ncbi:MAG: ABC transporter ATP-binding protein [bacterium]|nr:ABC transporter ATP-binding protein [bacterium]